MLSLLLALTLTAHAAFASPILPTTHTKAISPWGGAFIHASRGNRVLIHQSFGSTRVKPDALFPIASLTKQMTSLLLLRLEAKGRIRAEESLGAFFPEMRGNPVTLQELIEHRGGVNDMQLTQSDLLSYGNFNCPDLSALSSIRPIDYELYSNVGYCLVAKALEKRMGKDFASLLREELFQPLGMGSSKAVGTEERVPGLLGLSPITENPNREVPALPQNYFGSANVVSTGNDLALWKRVYTDPAYFAPMLSSLPTLPEDTEIYRWGLRISRYGKTLRLLHTGKIEGHTSVMVYYPEEDLFVVALVDSTLEGEIELGLGFLLRQLKSL